MKEEVECVYCFCMVSHGDTAPDQDDDEAWEELATEHADDCEWILTRAHRQEAAK